MGAEHALHPESGAQFFVLARQVVSQIIAFPLLPVAKSTRKRDEQQPHQPTRILIKYIPLRRPLIGRQIALKVQP